MHIQPDNIHQIQLILYRQAFSPLFSMLMMIIARFIKMYNFQTAAEMFIFPLLFSGGEKERWDESVSLPQSVSLWFCSFGSAAGVHPAACLPPIFQSAFIRLRSGRPLQWPKRFQDWQWWDIKNQTKKTLLALFDDLKCAHPPLPFRGCSHSDAFSLDLSKELSEISKIMCT